MLPLGQFPEDTCKHRVCRPPFAPILERLVRVIVSGYVDPMSPTLEHMVDPTQNLAIIGTTNAPFLGERTGQSVQLVLQKAKIHVTWVILLASMTHSNAARKFLCAECLRCGYFVEKLFVDRRLSC